MTTLGIRYLMGCAVSSDATRQRCEFPPHVGRIFMSMAAAHFETRGGDEERHALEWLENQGAPHLSAPEFAERRPSRGRPPIETYVPVNDKTGGVVARSRQARSFPTARLYDDKVFLMWDAEAPEEIRSALDRLCSKVTRIGHSSSLVQMWVVDRPEELRATLVPDQLFSRIRVRVVEPGTLAYLEKSFANEERPRLSRWHGYRDARHDSAVAAYPGPFDSRLIVFDKIEGRLLGLEATLQLTSALRNAAMKALPEGASPEWLSGHQPDGAPSVKPHVAFLPLPFVDAPYADGHILGLGMAIPREVPSDQARRVIGSLLFDSQSGQEHTIRLWRNDGFWEWHLKRETREYPPTALRPETWTEASCIWASVTPIVLHHHPKKNRDGDVDRILSEAFVSAGFPKPKALLIRPASVFAGAPHARSMPDFTEGGAGLCRYQTHAIAVFDQCVQGPVLVGRGRYRGYGLCRPVRPRMERT